MTLRRPELSVVIPTYRRNDLLARCLDALSPGVQTLPAEHYEVIVTDDGPEGDNAQAMVAERYPWARWTQGPRRGPAANRNHGARQVRSEWIVFTDDDCVPDPGWLKAFADARTAHPDAEVLEGKTVCREGIPSPLYASPTNETGGYLWSCNMAIAKALFDELNGFDESFPFAAMEDVDLRERILSAGRRFPFVTEAVVNHPPRPVPPPKRRAQMAESGFLFDSRRGQSPRKAELLKQVAYFRLREIYWQPKGVDSFRAVGHLLAELWELNRLFPSWQSKYGSA
ncbi:MAG: glycosyltransferase [Fimbriimonadaceae bacterium]